MTITIRAPVDTDVPFFAAEFTKAVKESALASFPVNAEKLLSMMTHVARSNMAMIAEDDGKPVGVLALMESTHAFSDKPYISDIWFYVLPQYRATRAAHLLLMKARGYAEHAKAPILIGTMWGDADGRIGQMLEKYGFRRLGGLYGWGF